MFVLMNCTLAIIAVTYYDFNFTDLSVGITVNSILGIAWIISFRKLRTVHVDNDFFMVDNQKVFFKDVISIERNIFAKIYKIKFTNEKEVKSFVFRPNFIIVAEPSYFDEIRTMTKSARTSDP